MSDYVTNLARRSVGLTPLAAPRVPTAPLVPDPVREPPAAATTPARGLETVRVEPSMTALAQPNFVHTEHVQPSVPPPIDAAAMSPQRSEVRMPQIEVAARESTRVETTVFVSEKTLLAPRPEPVLKPAPARETPTTQMAPVEQGEPSSAAPQSQELPAPMVLPARVEPTTTDGPTQRELVTFETVRELTHRFEKILEPVPAAPALPAIVPLAPVAVSATHRLPDLPAPENRIVQVRIGSIEIHGAAPAAVPAPAPVAASAAAARAASGGFDQFTRLRNYAQWEW